MAETPFSPEIGSESGGAMQEADNQPGAEQPAAGVEALPQLDASPASQPGIAASLAEPGGEPPATSPAVEASAFVHPQAGGGPAAAEAVVPPAAEPAPQPPGVATTVAIPPLEDAGEGGEWQLLVARINAWLGSGEWNRQWQRIRGPLKGLAILVLLVVVLRVYATAVATLEAIPLVSGLLELTGLLVVLRFSATKLVRSGDRRELAERIRQRWQAFSGRS